MNRFALLIDAGYLMGGGGELTVGTAVRPGLSCNHETLVSALVEYSKGVCEQELLRVYWYDGAPDAVPTNEHLIVGALNNVKVRLGRLTRSGQKGVDSRIVRDLMTLARERAITTAFLLSGDEDLREGVADAQEVGVRVILLGIPTTHRGVNQAPSLVREADEHIMLPKEFWSEHIALRSDLIQVQLGPDFIDNKNDAVVVAEIGRAFAEEWVSRASTDEVYALAKLHPRIPADLDTDLLIAMQLAKGRHIARRLRTDLRQGFWDHLLSVVALFDASALADEESSN